MTLNTFLLPYNHIHYYIIEAQKKNLKFNIIEAQKKLIKLQSKGFYIYIYIRETSDVELSLAAIVVHIANFAEDWSLLPSHVVHPWCPEWRGHVCVCVCVCVCKMYI